MKQNASREEDFLKLSLVIIVARNPEIREIGNDFQKTIPGVIDNALRQR
jgi:hypothetical protein